MIWVCIQIIYGTFESIRTNSMLRFKIHLDFWQNWRFSIWITISFRVPYQMCLVGKKRVRSIQLHNSYVSYRPIFIAIFCLILLLHQFILNVIHTRQPNISPNTANFDASSNNLTGTIPIDLIKWKELMLLDFSDNTFKSEIPDKCCTNIDSRKLEKLDMSDNSFIDGMIPDSLLNCAVMSEFVLSFM